MRLKKASLYFFCCLLGALAGCTSHSERPGPMAATDADFDFNVPIHYQTLDNGLKVVISEDRSAPIAALGVYYNIGFRIEPQDRTGFAHLFEHMMFQGSDNLGKMEFIRLIQENGGILNGSTRFDFTNYWEVVPVHTLETMLWAEADRMRGLNITQENLTNQQEVVKNEVRVNVLNQPYGGFPWLMMPQAAFDNWYNAHNFYGDLEDLDAANLNDVQEFFDRYYAPNNAVLVVVGDVDVGQTMAWVEQYFSPIPAAQTTPLPDISEARQTHERVVNKFDPLAPKPAFAFGYRMPERGTPEYYAMGIIDQLLVQGSNSLLHKRLVNRAEITGQVDGGINWGLGNMFNYNGPMLWLAHFNHNDTQEREEILTHIDSVIDQLANHPLAEEQLELAKTRLRSSFYDTLESTFGIGKVDLLASFALFDDDPGKINQIEDAFEQITPELIQRTAREYLRQSNRTIVTITPGEAPEEA